MMMGEPPPGEHNNDITNTNTTNIGWYFWGRSGEVARGGFVCVRSIPVKTYNYKE